MNIQTIIGSLIILLAYAGYSYLTNWREANYLKRFIKLYKASPEPHEAEMLVKMVQPVKSLLSKAGVEPLLVPYAQQNDERHVSTGHANPLDNLFNPDHRVPQTIITSVTQAIGYFEHKANQSINPLYWIDILFNAPKLLLNYLDFSSPIIEKVLDVAWKVALLYYLIAQIDFPVNLPTF